MTAQLFYEEQIAFYSKAIQSVKQKTGLFAMLRLVAFSLFAISFYFLIKEFTGGLLFLTLVVLAVFLSLVVYALKLRDTKLLLEKLHFVNANELGMLSNDTNAFDDGTVLMNDKGFAQDRSGIWRCRHRTWHYDNLIRQLCKPDCVVLPGQSQ